MLCWLITICTIARLWIVISWFVWQMRTRESDRDSAVRTALCIRDSFECCERGRSQVWPTGLAFAIRERERGTEGGAESERLGWHSRFANENEGRREEVSLNDSLNDSPLPETRLNERTNERTTLFGELNDANWFAETNHEIHHYIGPLSQVTENLVPPLSLVRAGAREFYGKPIRGEVRRVLSLLNYAVRIKVEQQ